MDNSIWKPPLWVETPDFQTVVLRNPVSHRPVGRRGIGSSRLSTEFQIYLVLHSHDCEKFGIEMDRGISSFASLDRADLISTRLKLSTQFQPPPRKYHPTKLTPKHIYLSYALVVCTGCICTIALFSALHPSRLRLPPPLALPPPLFPAQSARLLHHLPVKGSLTFCFVVRNGV